MKQQKIIVMLSLFATLFLVGATIQAGTVRQEARIEPPSTTMSITADFSQPQIQEQADSIVVLLDEATGYQNIPGEPVLPLVTRTVEVPFGSTVKETRCTLVASSEVHLPAKIAAAAKPAPYQTDEYRPIADNPMVYTTNQLFPETWYTWQTTGGLNADNILTTFITLQIYPVRYNPVSDVIQSINSITIDITYEQPLKPFAPLSDSYTMVIICYDAYASALEPLVTHKNAHGVPTKLVTINDIKTGVYFPAEGRDTQETIKYFIKNAKETWNITYVLLVGNYAQVPIRYSYVATYTGLEYEELIFPSDHYYADVYFANGSFCSWDTDNDGRYAEWLEFHEKEDQVDMMPDVYVGRLACMWPYEVKTVVDKIITYETTAARADWSNRMVVIGGDTYDKKEEMGTDYNEGEEVTGKALEIMSSYTPTRLWTSHGNITTTSIHDEISKGCGFLFFAGHGAPHTWATHNNGDYSTWVGEFKTSQMWTLSNKDKHPILIVGGCHNSQIDVRPLNIIIGFLKEKFHYFSSNASDWGSFWKYNWVPECWSWVFVKVRGGAIATLGSSGYGCDQIGDGNSDGIPDCTQYYDGWLELEFFRLYSSQENSTTLGKTYYQAAAGYVETFPVFTNQYDIKVLQTHTLLGDPSLVIGGYT
jgi:hypothetical protein